MSEPASLLSTLDKTSAPIVGAFALACIVAVSGYYAGAPGFSLMDGGAVGAVTFAGFLALLVLGVKLRRARPSAPKMKRRFAKLSETQRDFLMQVRVSGKAWFKAHAAHETWFKDLAALDYVEIARPLMILDDGPLTYQLTAQGKRELDRAARQTEPSWLARLRSRLKTNRAKQV